MGAIVGHIFFDTYASSLKATYFYTGATAPYFLNRLLQYRRLATVTNEVADE